MLHGNLLASLFGWLSPRERALAARVWPHAKAISSRECLGSDHFTQALEHVNLSSLQHLEILSRDTTDPDLCLSSLTQLRTLTLHLDMNDSGHALLHAAAGSLPSTVEQVTLHLVHMAPIKLPTNDAAVYLYKRTVHLTMRACDLNFVKIWAFMLRLQTLELTGNSANSGFLARRNLLAVRHTVTKLTCYSCDLDSMARVCPNVAALTLTPKVRFQKRLHGEWLPSVWKLHYLASEVDGLNVPHGLDPSILKCLRLTNARLPNEPWSLPLLESLDLDISRDLNPTSGRLPSCLRCPT